MFEIIFLFNNIIFQVVDVSKSTVSMLGTKVEIKLKKAEPGAWAKLDFPRKESKEEMQQPVVHTVEEDDSVDLSTVESIQSIGNVNVTDS